MSMLMIHKLSATSLWNCPGNGGCIAFPNSWHMDDALLGESQFLGLWKEECSKKCPCSYDSTVSANGDCIYCNTMSQKSEHHKVPIPTILQACDHVNGDEFVCEEGYYLSHETQSCVACKETGGATCGYGLYFERCQTTDELICKTCTNPIPNETSQTYGSYRMMQSCLFSDEPFQMINGIPTCALFLTPSWNDYQCSIECRANFIDIGSGQNHEPICLPCYEVCSVGEYCKGGSSTMCQKCEGDLENNMVWLPDTSVYDYPCRADCAEGFYKSIYNNLRCTPCLQNQKCTNSSEIFIGCRDQSPGRCQAPNVICTPGETYLYFQVYLSQAECRTCSKPEQGLTFIHSNCSAQADTVLRTCLSTCPPGYFKARNCTLTLDTVCQRCSNPINMKGLQLIGSCGGQRDYTFAPCPSGYACDGTANIYECPWPMFADQGLCKCPHGTYLSGEKCTVVQCISGQYPHPETGVCTPCTNQSFNHNNNNHSITLDDVWGEEACACEEGYFIQRLPEPPPIRCWPCGDLTCKEGVQYQTQCPGTSSLQPECRCRLPPGVVASNDAECSFSTCEDGLEKTKVFDSMASIASRLWNGSFWIAEKKEQDAGTLLEDSALSSITSITAVNKNTLVYVLDHKSLWVLSKSSGAWTTGSITNDLFIVGYRNNSNNIILDIMVCSDTREGRFWLGFVMLSTFCGDIYHDEGDGESLTLCSNVELIQIKNQNENHYSTVCIPIQNTQLCAENMYRSWNNHINSGIPLTRIYVMTMDNSYGSHGDAGKLYMAIGQEGSSHASEIYTYSVQYLDDVLEEGPQQQQQNNLASFQINVDPTKVISSLVWAHGNLFALVDGRFTPLTANYFSGVARIVLFFEGIGTLRQLQAGPGANVLFALSSRPNNILYEIDLWNGMVLEKYEVKGRLTLSMFSAFDSLFSVHRYFGNRSVVVMVDSIEKVCGVDSISFSQGECTILPCLLLQNSCGDNSVRTLGSSLCQCMPGYFLDASSKQCRLCKPNCFCSGNNEWTACPLNSNSIEGASSIAQCLCNKGYYKFKQNLCLLCPKGFWCFGQFMPPIKCTTGSNTLTTGAQSPVECLCQARTQGIDCKACASTDVCLLLGQDQLPRISAFLLSGYGPANADHILNKTCLSWGVSIVYSLPWSQRQSMAIGFHWSWMIVSEPLPSNANDENLLNNISTCLAEHNFSIQDQEIYTRLTLATNVQRATPCGLNLEWSGDLISGQPCTCIAGYEKVTNPSNQFRWCSPCMIGTVRQKKSSGRCIPCQDNNSHAPWLGMDHCICKEGYFMDHSVQKCVPNHQSRYGLLSSPYLVIPLTVTMVIICFLSLWLVSVYSA